MVSIFFSTQTSPSYHTMAGSLGAKFCRVGSHIWWCVGSTLFTAVSQPMCDTSCPRSCSNSKSTCMTGDRKIWKLFQTCGNGRKTTKCDQFFHPGSDFFNFCNPFFYHTLTTISSQQHHLHASVHCPIHIRTAFSKDTERLGWAPPNFATI